ncbi:alpha/beta fold hydrolase [Streptomyces yaizuensis]|uniref:Alpha/beta hydrolase n=1 Tax=Streptomyces yaizuensis TaxID=2989713 RepID=A0ABQ5PA48_9ACTN|nr:alpha/beta hydrolase [Streptomyces sp. YSPA8]GLF99468.1 alpha/beta hydrolase [Streptomyces sp. YSPA8]
MSPEPAVRQPAAPHRTLHPVSADGSRIHARVHGPEGAPAVVLIHGWTCSTEFWNAQIRELSAEYRVVVYDQRGHGRTPAAPTGTDLLADDLEAVLSAVLEPGEKAVIAGHSMGGMTVMAAARRAVFNDHAAAVLLLSTGSSHLVEESRVFPLRRGPLRFRLTLGVIGSNAPMGPVNPLSRWLLRYATMSPRTPAYQVAECARIVHACPRQVRAAWARALASLDLSAGVRELRVPTVVACGTEDRLTPMVHARRLAALLPDCVELVEISGAGHMTPVEAPMTVSSLIRGLVRDHAPATADTSSDSGTSNGTSNGTSEGERENAV